MRKKLHSRNQLNSVRSIVIRTPIACNSCGYTIDEDNWCFRVNGVYIHDNGQCIEVWKFKHGLKYNKFRVAMRLSAVVEE